MRGFKCDEAATAEAGFHHYRSFVSQPKAIEGECAEPKPHLLLHGEDKAPIRAEIFRRNREANGGMCRCVKCDRIVLEHLTEDADPIVFQMKGDWHHRRNKPGERCDCPANGEVICGGPFGCHREEHPQTQFGKSKIARETS